MKRLFVGEFSITSNQLVDSFYAMPEKEVRHTNKVEDIGKKLINSKFQNIKDVKNFSEEVCKWGGGERVYANLARRNNQAFPSDKIQMALIAASHAKTHENAIAPFIEIKGLGISFGSKHLRMLLPDRFAVLDSVLCERLGFALNLKGYSLFMREMERLSVQLKAEDKKFQNLSIATIEMALYKLIQQSKKITPAL